VLRRLNLGRLSGVGSGIVGPVGGVAGACVASASGGRAASGSAVYAAISCNFAQLARSSHPSVLQPAAFDGLRALRFDRSTIFRQAVAAARKGAWQNKHCGRAPSASTHTGPAWAPLSLALVQRNVLLDFVYARQIDPHAA
jgi:hypothetical protein